jgi:hypothetical protein
MIFLIEKKAGLNNFFGESVGNKSHFFTAGPL